MRDLLSNNSLFGGQLHARDFIFFTRCFVCFLALHLKSTAMVIAGQTVYLAKLFPGQA